MTLEHGAGRAQICACVLWASTLHHGHVYGLAAINKHAAPEMTADGCGHDDTECNSGWSPGLAFCFSRGDRGHHEDGDKQW